MSDIKIGAFEVLLSIFFLLVLSVLALAVHADYYDKHHPPIVTKDMSGEIYSISPAVCEYYVNCVEYTVVGINGNGEPYLDTLMWKRDNIYSEVITRNTSYPFILKTIVRRGESWNPTVDNEVLYQLVVSRQRLLRDFLSIHDMNDTMGR